MPDTDKPAPEQSFQQFFSKKLIAANSTKFDRESGFFSISPSQSRTRISSQPKAGALQDQNFGPLENHGEATEDLKCVRLRPQLPLAESVGAANTGADEAAMIF